MSRCSGNTHPSTSTGSTAVTQTQNINAIPVCDFVPQCQPSSLTPGNGVSIQKIRRHVPFLFLLFTSGLVLFCPPSRALDQQLADADAKLHDAFRAAATGTSSRLTCCSVIM